MLVSRFGFVRGLSRLLLRAHVVVAAVLLSGCAMCFGSLLVMFSRLLMHILRHVCFLAGMGGSPK